jgi:hypothetical protein
MRYAYGCFIAIKKQIIMTNKKVLAFSLLLAAGMSKMYVNAGIWSAMASLTFESPSDGLVWRVQQESGLQKFEGFYRFPNRVAYIQFVLNNGKLEARQLWDGRVYVLQSTGESSFQSVDEGYKLVFDLTTVPSQVKILDRVILNKVSYDPGKRQEPSKKVRQQYQGRYRLAKDTNMWIRVAEKQGMLVLHQEWDNKEIVLESMTDSEYINEELIMPVSFEILTKGGVRMHCFENDIWEKIN